MCLLLLRSINMLVLQVALAVFFTLLSGNESLQLNRFSSNVVLNGKLCPPEHRLFRRAFEADVVFCTSRCETFSDCRSVFYHNDDRWCVGCANAYGHDTGLLLEAAGTHYFGAPRKVFNGSFYKFTSLNMTFNAAKDYCESLGGYILQVESAEENEFIATHIGDRPVWLGLSDEGHERVWEWVHYNSTTGYTNWKPSSKPATANDRPGENCAAIISHYGYQWSDRDCNRRFNVVCKFQ